MGETAKGWLILKGELIQAPLLMLFVFRVLFWSVGPDEIPTRLLLFALYVSYGERKKTIQEIHFNSIALVMSMIYA